MMKATRLKQLIGSFVLAAGLMMLAGLLLDGWGDTARAQEPSPSSAKIEPPVELETTGDVTAAGVDKWTPLNGPWADGGTTTALAVSPNVSGTVYAIVDSIYGGGHLRLYATSNGGVSWTPKYTIPHGIPELGGSEEVYGLAFTGSRIVYGTTDCLDAGTCGWVTPDGGASIYRSTDGGTSFTPVYTSPFGIRHEVLDLKQNPVTPTILFAVGTEDSAPNMLLSIVRSTDDGLNWTHVYTEPTSGGSLAVMAISPHTPTLVLVGGDRWGTGPNPIYRSPDGGESWTQVYTVPENVPITDLGFDPTDPNRVYIATTTRNFYRSVDAGLTWTQLVSNSSAGNEFVVTNAAPPTIIATHGDEVLTSMNGVTWTLVSYIGGGVNVLKLGPGNVLWAGVSEGLAVSRSDDDGITWNTLNSGIQSLVGIDDIEPDPFNPGTFYVVPGGWGVPGAFKSTDGGNTWSQLFPSVGGSGGSITTHPTTPNLLLAGLTSTIQRSTNGGITWTKVYDIQDIYPSWDGDVFDLGFHPANPQIAYAVGEDNPITAPMEAFILRSIDGGLNWTRLFTRTTGCTVQCGFTSLSFDPIYTNTVFVSGGQQSGGPLEGVVYRTTDGGNSWTAVLTHPDEYIRTVAVAPWNPDYVYAATEGVDSIRPGDETTFYRSTDGGENWTVILSNTQGNLVNPDVSVPNRLYLSSPYWAGVSFDAGDTFFDLAANGELPVAQYGGALAIRPGEVTQTLYIGSLGVWEKSIGNFENLNPTPGSGATTRDGVLSIEVGFSMVLTYTPLISLSHDIGDATFAGIAFTIDADSQTEGQIGTIPATMTLSYAKAYLPAGVNEEQLQVYRWDEASSEWQPLTVLARDTVAKTITVLLDHLSEFALLEEGKRSVYLPIVLK